MIERRFATGGPGDGNYSSWRIFPWEGLEIPLAHARSPTSSTADQAEADFTANYTPGLKWSHFLSR